MQQAEDLHELIEVLGSYPVEMFTSSGGAVTALALVAAHPADVMVLVAHEPPLLGSLPDPEWAFAAEVVSGGVPGAGLGAGLGAFIAPTSCTEAFAARPTHDPAQFGLPTEDDGSRDDPLRSCWSNLVTAYRPDSATR